MALTDVAMLIVIAVAGFLIAGALSPFEALGWWAGWFGSEEPEDSLPEVSSKPQMKHAVVFLSGIHSVSGESYSERELAFLEKLRERLPDVEVIEVFPYSVTNRALTGQRFFAWFWRWALKMKVSGAGVAGFVINLRNLWQVAVSADRRYGPIYNQGSADMIYHALIKAGYSKDHKVPVTLIGYSGGGQIAAGAAPHLKHMINAPITVISLGGVISSDLGLPALEHVYHLYGQRDNVQRLGLIFFPGRWRILPYSSWNQAIEKHIITLIKLGPMDHTGPKGYLDSDTYTPDGRSYLDVTLDTITALISNRPRPQMNELTPDTLPTRV